jgi:hypothetical protein
MVTPTFSGSSISVELLPTLFDVSGSRKSNMAVWKPEVLISQLVDKIEKLFKDWYPIFGVQKSGILVSVIELAILKNMVVAFAILVLSCLQAVIHVLPVNQPPSWISVFR